MYDMMKRCGIMIAGVTLLAACDDPWGGTMDPVMVEDTFEIAAPRPDRTDVPSALDVMVTVSVIGGPRFPEESAHALRWDVVLHEEGDSLLFRTPADLGLGGRARIAAPILDRSIEEVDRAAGVRDSAAVARPDAVYVVRSRRRDGCEQHAKFTPIEFDRDDARVTLRVITNGRCGDDRLPPVPD